MNFPYLSLIDFLSQQFVLEDIFWADTPLLESVGEHEPKVEELREHIRDSVNKALIPMRAYARAYEKYLELRSYG